MAQRLPTGGNIYKYCPVCGKRYANQKSLDKHIEKGKH
jgi:uncharacterized C2H2 Zn-finger protein